MNRVETTAGRRARTAAVAACGLFLLAATNGCGAPATFVSAEPPPDTAAEAWYTSPVPEVSAAIGRAMRGARMAVDPEAGGVGTIVGTKQQVPYVGTGAGAPASGPLPVYRVVVTVRRTGDLTHARASLEVVCPSCAGGTPYEWQYPGDLFRDVFEGARRILSERGGKASYPPRHRPVRWCPPKRH